MRKKAYIYIILLSYVFTGCVIQDIPDIKKGNEITDAKKKYFHIALDSVVVHIKDSSGYVPIEKSIIFNSNLQGYKYAYGDILPLNNEGHLMAVAMRSTFLSDFASGHLIVSESLDYGATWSDPVEITDLLVENYINMSSPSLLRVSNTHIMLFYAVKYSVGRIDIRYKESFDNGKTWGQSQIVYSDKRGYQIMNNGRIRYQNGIIIIPVSIPTNKYQMYNDTTDDLGVFYYYSKDLGKTWSQSDVLITDIGLMEPGITQLTDKEYLMNIRINKGSVLFARSLDGGNRWNFEPSDIKSTDAPQTLFSLKGQLIMIWNNRNLRNQNSETRSLLSFAISHNKGKEWKRIFDIENGHLNYSYTSISEDKEYLFITYYDLIYYVSSSLKLVKIKITDLSGKN